MTHKQAKVMKQFFNADSIAAEEIKKRTDKNQKYKYLIISLTALRYIELNKEDDVILITDEGSIAYVQYLGELSDKIRWFWFTAIAGCVLGALSGGIVSFFANFL